MLLRYLQALALCFTMFSFNCAFIVQELEGTAELVQEEHPYAIRLLSSLGSIVYISCAAALHGLVVVL